MQTESKKPRATGRAAGKVYAKKLADLESQIREVLGGVQDDMFGFAIDLSTITCFIDMAINMYKDMDAKKKESFDKIVSDFTELVSKKLCDFHACRARKTSVAQKEKSFVYDPSHDVKPQEKHMLRGGVMVSFGSTDQEKTPKSSKPESSAAAKAMFFLGKSSGR